MLHGRDQQHSRAPKAHGQAMMASTRQPACHLPWPQAWASCRIPHGSCGPCCRRAGFHGNFSTRCNMEMTGSAGKVTERSWHPPSGAQPHQPRSLQASGSPSCWLWLSLCHRSPPDSQPHPDRAPSTWLVLCLRAALSLLVAAGTNPSSTTSEHTTAQSAQPGTGACMGSVQPSSYRSCWGWAQLPLSPIQKRCQHFSGVPGQVAVHGGHIPGPGVETGRVGAASPSPPARSPPPPPACTGPCSAALLHSAAISLADP